MLDKMISFKDQLFLISLIIPVYNTEPNLFKDCIDSIIRQTYGNLEIIIVDDGSTEDIGKYCNTICNLIQENGMQGMVIHKENGGISSARNVGLDECHGDYICYIDSDDILDKHYCELLLFSIIHAGVCVSSCGFREFHNCINYEVIGTRKNPIVYSGIDIWLSINMGYVWNKMFDANIFKECKFNIRYSMAEDADYNIMWYELYNSCALYDDVLYYHRINPSSVSSNLSAIQYAQAIEVWEKQLSIPEYKKISKLVNRSLFELCGWRLRYCMALSKERPEGWKQTLKHEKVQYNTELSPHIKYCHKKLLKISYTFFNAPDSITILYLTILRRGFDLRRSLRTLLR